MSGFKTLLRSGHRPTLLASFISKSFGLDAAQMGFMISVPILAAAYGWQTGYGLA